MKQKDPNSQSGWKDFLYDTNDVLITVLILIAALIIIGWRVNVIMQYPKHMTTSSVKTTSEVQQDANKSSSDQNSSSDSSDKAAAATDKDSDTNKDTDKVVAQYKDGYLVKTITITIESGSLNGALDQLKEYKLFDTRHEFKVYCHQQGLKAGDIKAGEHKLKKGWTKAKIAKELTK
jgi:hypothetical protein